MEILYRILVTLNEMIVDRGFPSNSNLQISQEQFKEDGFEKTVGQIILDESCSKIGFTTSNQEKKLLVIFNDEIKKEIIIKIQKYIKQNECFECIIILTKKDKVTSQVRTLIRSLEEKGFFYQVFNKSDLKINVTKSNIVPKHILLTKEQKQMVFKNLKCKNLDDELPEIQKDDPQTRYYGAKVGDVFKIMRLSETTGFSVYYRVVVE